MGIEVLGVDLGKTVCSLAGLDATGPIVYRKRLQRHRLRNFWKSRILALLRLRLAAARITLVVFAFNTDMSLG